MTKYTPLTLEQRNAVFWSKVDKSGGEAACWIWIGSCRREYGRFYVRGKSLPAHRYAYELYYGVIPPNLLVCHNCPGGDNPLCVNPAHLFLGTQKDNVHDMMRKGRIAKGERAGMRVHPESVKRGEQNYAAKFTDADVRSIRQRYADGGVTLQSLANEFSVNKTAIHKIVSRQTWRHIG